jgi:hypothetical protein
MANPVVPGFAWSYSQLKNFETCPKRYWHYNVLKDVVEPTTPELDAGNALHKVFEMRLKGVQLPMGYGQYESLLARILNAAGDTYAEQKLGVTSTFGPTAFFGKGSASPWLRTIIDATKVNGDKATVFDWKTGKPATDMTQCQLAAATAFIHLPQVQRVNTALVFVNYNKTESESFLREDLTEIWSEILPRVKAVEKARATQEYPPKPSGLCKKYCHVVSCPYHGKGA